MLQRSYLRYVGSEAFGVVASPNCNRVLSDATGTVAYAGAVEDVLAWNLKTGVEVRRFHVSDTEVTTLAMSPDGAHLAAGYSDGTVRLWNVADGTCRCTFAGHRSAVNTIAFSSDSAMVASGGQDTDVVLWDVIAETGLFRLHGHKDAVTDARFVAGNRQLMTSGKDSMIKFWDLDTRHCVQTLVAARGEVWSFDVDPAERRIVCGTSENELRVFDMTPEAEVATATTAVAAPTDAGTAAAAASSAPDVEHDLLHVPMPRLMGTLPRESRDRVGCVRFSADGVLVMAQGTDKVLDLYRVRSPEDAQHRTKRRLKRRREKLRKLAASDATAAAPTAPASAWDAAGDADTDAVIAADEFEAFATLRAEHRLRAAALLTGRRPGEAVLLCSTHNNSLEKYTVAGAGAAPVRALAVELPGHRTTVRAVALSADDTVLLSASSEEAKVWNVVTRRCIRTIATGYGVASCFLPGSRHAVLGTKSGNLQLLDIGAATVMEDIPAHKAAVWAVQLHPRGRQVLTGSADKEVKLWDLALVPDENAPGGQRLTLSLAHTVTMTEEVLSACYSPDGKYLAVALMDNTIKVFYADSLKFYLSLYGHKLPVTTLDISSDSQLLISGSADKNVRIWGLDFGDCRKSLFAHDGSVTAVAFVRHTHLFFSAGKDGNVKYWDGDSYETVQTLRGHRGDVTCLATAAAGTLLVSAGADRSIRLWRETGETLFLVEEREAEAERRAAQDADKEGAPVIVGVEGESAPAARRTGETLEAGERLLDALAIADREVERWQEYAALAKTAEQRGAVAPKPPAPNPLLQGLEASQYVLQTLRRVPAAELEPVLSALPFAPVLQLMTHAAKWAREGWEPELVARTVLFLVATHHLQMAASASLLPALQDLTAHLRPLLQRVRDSIGFNLAAVRFTRAQIAEGIARETVLRKKRAAGGADGPAAKVVAGSERGAGLVDRRAVLEQS